MFNKIKEGFFDINLEKKGQLLVQKTFQDSFQWPDSWTPTEELMHGEIKRHAFGQLLAELRQQ